MAAGRLQCQGAVRQGAEAMAKRDEEREKRLAEALRQNLRRRKAQARGERDKCPPPEGEG